MTGSVYSVGQVNAYIKNMFAQDFMMRHIRVSGEVSNCKYHSSGHLYFTLKDESGVLKTVMFAGMRRSGLAVPMTVGDKVVVSGEFRVYERDGSYQLYAEHIQQQGVGLLYQKYAQLKAQLEEMGMFAQEYKRPIPRYASTVGIVTAATGAAIQDIRNISRRRNPFVQLILYPAKVQGEGAAESVAQGIAVLETRGVDVIIVGRGGGSIEDLWAFNEEVVARAIFACSVPVISAVGHETDVTIADFVADLRAPTPSAAAELAIFDLSQTIGELRGYQDAFGDALMTKVELSKKQLKHKEEMLDLLNPRNLLQERRQLTMELEESFSEQMAVLLERKRSQLALLAAELESYSPLKRLQGGYAYVTHADGRRIFSVRELAVDEEIFAYLLDGRVRARVQEASSAQVPCTQKSSGGCE